MEELAEGLHHHILSVGGGTPLKEENRRLLSRMGTVVYLRVQPGTVYERLKGDTTRPLLQGPEPLARITELMDQRKDLYEKGADLILDVDGMEMEEILEKIIR